MLILTRKKDENIIIDDEIEIKIVAIEGNQVRLGIDAPNNIEIHREEVYRRIEEENKEAAKSQIENLGDVMKIVEKRRKIGEKGSEK